MHINIILFKMEKLKDTEISIQYFSDLHLELYETDFKTEIPVAADTLVFAGDMGDITKGPTQKFFANMCAKFKDIVYVTGNHEYYQEDYTYAALTFDEVNAKTEEFCAKFPNLHFLNCKSWVHPSGLVTFHGCTLWSNVLPKFAEKVELALNDYNLIYTTKGPKDEPCKKRIITAKDTNYIKISLLKLSSSV